MLALQSAACALEGMVVRLEDKGNVVINRGVNHNTQPQTTYYVTRMRKPIAKLKVVQVDEYSSLCTVEELMPGQKVQVGDTVSLKPFPKPVEKDDSRYTSQPLSEIEKDKMKARAEYKKELEERYKDVVGRKTKIVRFKKGAGGVVKVNTFDIYNLASTFMFSGPYASFNIWHGLSSAYGVYAGYKSTQNPKRIRNLQIEMTLWDTEYLDAFASYNAHKKSVSDPRAVNRIKENIYRQKGLDKFYVFQVKIINPGPGPVQLAPFPWHCFVKGPDGKKIKAVNYDEILDKALSPKQVVNGYVYFSRYDKTGQPILKGGEVTVRLEDILGHSSDVTFK